MTLSDYAIDIALIGLVVWQIRGRCLTVRSLILPLALVGIVANSYLHGIPTAGNDLVLVVAGSAAGIILGALAGAFTSVRQDAEGHLIAKAGVAAAGLWVLGVGTRFAFQLYTSHGGEGTIARFSSAHSITSGEAWVAALVLMAIGEVLARTLVLGLRAYAVAPSQFCARTTMIDAGDRVN